MDNMNTSEKNAKISDSAYSNSCSNSQSRRSHSSKSTNWGSHSSGSSGYGGKPSTSGSSNQPPEKRTKEKEPKKKRQNRIETTEPHLETECGPPDPAPILEVPDEELIHVDQTPLPVLPMDKGPESMDISPPTTLCAKDEVLPCNVSIATTPANLVCSQPPASSSFDGFFLVISMHDGVVMYTTTSMTKTLGYDIDMWIGRSFINFVHPKDRSTFASQITKVLAIPKMENGMQVKVTTPEKSTSTIACRIRKYKALSAGFGVKEKVVAYMPFLLKLNFKNVSNEDSSEVIYLVIQATPFFSAFKVPNEVILKPIPFVIRHAANGNLEHIDPESVQYLGYLPQDVLGKDALQFYHPDDLCFLSQVYRTIVKEGELPRSQPYRMLTQNGHFLKLETEWSSFINPWTRKLEFVIGKHFIIEGPTNPDVLQTPDVKLSKTQDENYKLQLLSETIIQIMNNVLTKPAEAAKQQKSTRYQEIASFMENLIKTQPKTDQELRLEIQDEEHSYYDRDSMLGGISPHHEYDDSKSSTETPLSYNQINYNETLQRYFNSHQPFLYEDYNTVTGENVLGLKDAKSSSSDSFRKNGVQSTTMTRKQNDHFQHPTFNTPPLFKPGPLNNPILMNCLPPKVQLSGDSEEMASSCESGLTMRVSSHCPVGDYQPVKLTEALLTKHNTDLEKELFRLHRENRSNIKEEREKTSNETRKKKKEHLARCNASFQPTTAGGATSIQEPTEERTKGVKRSSNEVETATGGNKHHCSSSRQNRRHTTTSAVAQPSANITTTVAASYWNQSPMNNMNTYILGVSMPPPMSVMSPMVPQQMAMQGLPGMFPMYYAPPAPTMPSTSETNTQDPTKSNPQFQAPSMQCMMYGQPVYGYPFMYSPIAPQVQYPIQHQQHQTMPLLGLTSSNYEKACNPGLPPRPNKFSSGWRDTKRSELQANSSKDGLNSADSNSSANALNRSKEAVSKTSSNRNGKEYPLRMTSSEETTDRTDGESSYSSFHSSFFKTDSGSAIDSGDVKKENKKNKVCFTSELVYKYQILTKSMEEVLLADKQKISQIVQPSLVNEQLGQLYRDLQIEGVASRLTLEEGITSSSSSGEETPCKKSKGFRKKREHSKLVMIYEEDAPLPPAEEEEEEAIPSSSAT